MDLLFDLWLKGAGGFAIRESEASRVVGESRDFSRLAGLCGDPTNRFLFLLRSYKAKISNDGGFNEELAVFIFTTANEPMLEDPRLELVCRGFGEEGGEVAVLADF